MFESLPDLLTIKDVQVLLGYSYMTVRNMCADGRLPSCKIGHRVFVPKAKLEEFINNQVDTQE